MELILWRHADAELPNTDDLSRALTERGRKQAARMAAWLTPRLPQNVRILASPALRTQETARALGRHVLTEDRLAPGAGLDALLDAVGWPDERGTLLVVGHQPTLGQAARFLLTGQGDGELSIRKAAVWWFQTRERDAQQHVVLRAVQHPDWL